MWHHEGMVLWFTGLPASGKTTLANLLVSRIQAGTAKVQVMDGDVIRRMKGEKIGYTREERIRHIRQVGQVARELKEQGVIGIVAVISPYREVRQAVIQEIGAVEIFVDAALEVCKQRDPKGLYAKALRGEIKNFTGIDDPYEPPLFPDIHLPTAVETPEECVDRVLEYLWLQRLLIYREDAKSSSASGESEMAPSDDIRQP
jgi:adenylyl-sulfate kinase